MKMAKASEADLTVAMELTRALEGLTQRWYPTMPTKAPEDDAVRFDRHNDEQCGIALRHILELVEGASIGRVVFGMAVLLDPANKLVDPDADTLEFHPTLKAAGDEAARFRNALEHIAGSCDGRAAEVARCALETPNTGAQQPPLPGGQ